MNKFIIDGKIYNALKKWDSTMSLHSSKLSPRFKESEIIIEEYKNEYNFFVTANKKHHNFELYYKFELAAKGTIIIDKNDIRKSSFKIDYCDGMEEKIAKHCIQDVCEFYCNAYILVYQFMLLGIIFEYRSPLETEWEIIDDIIVFKEYEDVMPIAYKVTLERKPVDYSILKNRILDQISPII